MKNSGHLSREGVTPEDRVSFCTCLYLPNHREWKVTMKWPWLPKMAFFPANGILDSVACVIFEDSARAGAGCASGFSTLDKPVRCASGLSPGHRVVFVLSLFTGGLQGADPILLGSRNADWCHGFNGKGGLNIRSCSQIHWPVPESLELTL